MSAAMSWLITLAIVLLLTSFAVYLWSLRRLSLGHRPLTRTYDRLGNVLGLAENPDYRENLVDEDVDIESPAERLAITPEPLPRDGSSEPDDRPAAKRPPGEHSRRRADGG